MHQTVFLLSFLVFFIVTPVLVCTVPCASVVRKFAKEYSQYRPSEYPRWVLPLAFAFFALANQSQRIIAAHWVIADKAVKIKSSLRPDRIHLHKPPQARRVVAIAEVVEAGVRVAISALEKQSVPDCG